MVDIALLLVAAIALGAAVLTVARTYRDPWRLLLLSMPLLLVLTPGVGNAPAIRLEEVLLFLLAPFIILRRPVFKITKLELFFLLYGLAVIVSIFIGSLLDSTIYVRDFLELMRLAKYWLIVRLALSLTWSEEHAGQAIQVLLWTGLVGACIALAQTNNAFGINDIYTPFFVKDIRLDSIQSHVPGTILNYNLFGTFLAMMSTLALSFLLFAPLSFQRKAITAAILVVCVYALVRTTSRGAFVALILSVILLWLLRLSLNRSRRALHVLALTVIVVFGIILGGAILREPETLSAGNPIRAFVSRFQPEHVERGFGLRAADWEVALDLASESIIFGTGPSKDEGVRAFHSEYLTHLRRYGFFGLAVYIAMLGASALTCIRLLRSRRIVTDGYARVLLAGTLGMLCVFVVTSAIYQVFDQLQLAAIFWWFVGIAFAYSGFTSSRQYQQLADADPARGKV